MIKIALVSGSLFGMLAVIFGAFGAHALKKTLTEDQLKSFETGVKYQMYHALVLLVIGLGFTGDSALVNYAVYAFLLGTFLFSFSIYGLVLSDARGKKLRFLGPVTPLGGLLLVLGWFLLLLQVLDQTN